MRLRDIINTINDNLGLLNPTVEGIQNDNNYQKLSNVFDIRKAVENIAETNAFQDELSNIKQFELLFIVHQNSISLPKSEAGRLTSYINHLKNKMVIFKSVAEGIIPEQSDYSISVKLPKVANLSQLAEVISKLDKIFNQLLVNDSVKGDVKLQNFDTGSEWIEIAFDSLKSLGIITYLVYLVILAKREKIKNDEAIEVVRNRRITNDLYEQMSNQLLKNTDKFVDKKIKEKMVNIGIDEKDNEYFERYKYCMSELSKLVEKGLQFFPSSKSPDEIKTTLPDFSQKKISDMLPESLRIANSEDTEKE